MPSTPEYVVANREYWTDLSKVFLEPGRRAWSSANIDWGIWSVLESDLGVLGPLDELRGKHSIELGCGTGYFSAWLVRAGMKAVGIDITPAQLANARAFQKEFGIEFPLIEASAEQVPLASETFDLAISEYGASIWCDPYEWIPEAARLLRPGGSLVFLRNSTLSILCSPDNGPVRAELMQDWRRLGKIQWEGDASYEFHIPHGEMIRLLRNCGLQVENLIEIMPPEYTDSCGWDYMTLAWANRWPSEEIWVAVRR